MKAKIKTKILPLLGLLYVAYSCAFPVVPEKEKDMQLAKVRTTDRI